MNTIENPSSEFERQFVLAINARRKLKGVSALSTVLLPKKIDFDLSEETQISNHIRSSLAVR